MPAKNVTEVALGGRVYTLSGYESEEYLQKVANYINTKLNEINANEGFRRQNAEVRSAMIYLNIADDYFKAKEKLDARELDMEAKDKKIADLTHELISQQLKAETAQKDCDGLKKEIAKLQKNVVRLEAELEANKK
jgi:cell division protein ZapA